MTNGLAMGNPLSPILSDIYMPYFESKLFKLLTFPFYKRYVDDSFALLEDNNCNLDQILNVMNSIDSCIQFTFELESDQKLPFLDVLVTRNDNSFHTTVFRKPFPVSLPPHYKSSHPPNQKLASFRSFVYRVVNICSNNDLLDAELNYIKAIAHDRGYSPNIIDNIHRNLTKQSHADKPSKEFSNNLVILPYFPKISRQVANILKKFDFNIIFSPINKIKFSNLKQPIDSQSSWGIYQINCQCGLSYIGQTKRALKCRVKEHEAYVKKQEFKRSSIAQHCWDSNHNFNFSSSKVIQNCSSIFDLDFYESYHIFKNSKLLVNDLSSVPYISPVWKSMIKPNYPPLFVPCFLFVVFRSPFPPIGRCSKPSCDVIFLYIFTLFSYCFLLH
ncbi:uncharacterized protein [Parasteatoda tepidariorum]|uniref:uncharacterized protein n=1 Tax=Parasteatoda tepidariorum TaxID=114398 RepID=UPI0039BCF99D